MLKRQASSSHKAGIRRSRKVIDEELREESIKEQEKGQAATEEMFKNVFNSLRNYLMPAGEPRRMYKEQMVLNEGSSTKILHP